jgi:hypothetical protein
MMPASPSATPSLHFHHRLTVPDARHRADHNSGVLGNPFDKGKRVFLDDQRGELGYVRPSRANMFGASDS